MKVTVTIEVPDETGIDGYTQSDVAKGILKKLADRISPYRPGEDDFPLRSGDRYSCVDINGVGVGTLAVEGEEK